MHWEEQDPGETILRLVLPIGPTSCASIPSTRACKEMHE